MHDMTHFMECVNVILIYVFLWIFRSLQQLLDYTEDDLEETFCLNFTVRTLNCC